MAPRGWALGSRAVIPDSSYAGVYPAELGRLEELGFEVERHSRGFTVRSSPEAIRASQLYSTLPHEVGHYAGYLKSRESFE